MPTIPITQSDDFKPCTLGCRVARVRPEKCDEETNPEYGKSTSIDDHQVDL